MFNSTRGGVGGNIIMKSVGVANDSLIVAAATSSWPSDWSRDGKSILFDQPSAKTQSDVWLLSAAGGAPRRILASAANEMQAVFSPDGKWIAYASDEENGVDNVYVRPFPLTAEQWKVSESGGEAPRWRPDGKELFFLMPHERDVSLMAAPIDTLHGRQAGRAVSEGDRRRRRNTPFGRLLRRDAGRQVLRGDDRAATAGRRRGGAQCVRECDREVNVPHHGLCIRRPLPDVH